MNQLEGKILLSTNDAHHIVSFDDILYCKSENSSTTFFLCNGEQINTSISIGLLESRLAEHSFVRSHQSYIVNMKHILRIHRQREIELELINDNFLPVSTRRKSTVMQFFNKVERIQRA